MNYKLLLCEACDSLLSVKQIDKPIFKCPICGCLNARKRVDEYHGRLIATSNKFMCESANEDDDDKDFISINLTEMSKEVQDALFILLKNGWKIKFEGIKKD